MSADQTYQRRNWQTALIALGLLLLAPILLLLLLGYLFVQIVALTAIWSVWLPQGKDTLVVYSRSPNWMEYFESTVLPRLHNRAVVLNWSDRKNWSPLALSTWAFRMFAGSRNFNPMVMVFKPLRWPRAFRFYDAFRQLKHGKETSLRTIESELAAYQGLA